MPQISFALASSNLVDAGTAADPPKDTAEFVYSGDIAELKGLKLELFEVDTGEHSDPAVGVGRRKSLAKFTADIVANSAPAAGQPPGTLKLTAKPKGKIDKDAPRFNLKLAGETFEIGLPDLKDEAGRRFEIQLLATADKLKLKFESKALLFARFGHFANDVKGAVIAFVTGGDDGLFFKVASIYWRQHADVVIAKDGMSLQEIGQFLAKQDNRILQETSNQGWGEVNIVCHGNAVQAVIAIIPKSPSFPNRDLRITELDRLLGNLPNIFSKGPFGLTPSSRIVFRACNIGHRPDLLKRVKQDVFGNICPVKAPLFLQTYFAELEPSTGAAREFFTEEVTVHFPGQTEPAAAVVDAALTTKFTKNQTKAAAKLPEKQRKAVKTQAFGVEKGTFKTKRTKHEQFPFSFPAANPELRLTLQDDKRTVLSVEGIVARDIDAAKDTDRFVFADAKRWQIGTFTGKRTLTNGLEVFAKSGTATAVRAFAPLGSRVIVQSDDDFLDQVKTAGRVQPGIHSPAAALSPGQQRIITPTPSGFTVTDERGATLLQGVINGEATFEHKVGAETLVISHAHQTTAGTVTSHRFSVSLRRELRDGDPSVPFDKRALTVPDINNAAHYGSSEDPAPSAEELTALAD